MRILELEIINFGKFNHETVTFHDGMNLIYGENEMGKTTLHSFIRGMFFGIEKQRGRAARKDEYSTGNRGFMQDSLQVFMRFEMRRQNLSSGAEFLPQGKERQPGMRDKR